MNRTIKILRQHVGPVLQRKPKTVSTESSEGRREDEKEEEENRCNTLHAELSE